jgi:polyhydroxyalkanoate synthesis regulator phasin
MADERTDVAGLVERAFLMGLGVMEMTRDRVSSLSKDLEDRGKMSESEAKKVADRMSSMASEQQESVRKVVDKESDRFLSATGVATKEDVEALRSEIAELKALIASRAGEAPPAE